MACKVRRLLWYGKKDESFSTLYRVVDETYSSTGLCGLFHRRFLIKDCACRLARSWACPSAIPLYVEIVSDSYSFWIAKAPSVWKRWRNALELLMNLFRVETHQWGITKNIYIIDKYGKYGRAGMYGPPSSVTNLRKCHSYLRAPAGMPCSPRTAPESKERRAHAAHD